MIKVSVIMPTYNRVKTLPRAIDSILAQTIEDIELIIVDDGSTDSTPELLREYSRKDPRVKIITQKNQGPAIARNNGVAIATAKNIAFMDSDDACSVNRIKIQLDFLLKHPQYLACALSGPSPIADYYPGVVANETDAHSVCYGSPLLRKQTFIALNATSLMTRESFIKVGGQRSQLTITEDLDFTLRYGHLYSWAIISDGGSYFYDYPETNSAEGETNSNLMAYMKRHLAGLICEWCRINELPDPVDQDKSLDEILSIMMSIPMVDKLKIYNLMLFFIGMLSSMSDMSRKQAYHYLLDILNYQKLDKITPNINTPPKISVVMATYNQVKTLAYAINSILSQQMAYFELIIVDDGSTDATPNILSNYARQDKRIKIITQKHQGLAVARNNGVAVATSKYITVIDADDACTVQQFESQLDFLQHNHQHSACCLINYGNVDGSLSRNANSKSDDYVSYASSIFKNNTSEKLRFLDQHILMTKESFLKLGGYRSSDAIIENIDFTMRYLSKYSIAGISDSSVYLYVPPSTINFTKTKDILDFTKRFTASLICEWCRHNGLEDPVDQGRGLDEILSINKQIPWKDGAIIYSYLYRIRQLIVAASDLSYTESKDIVLGLVSDNFLKKTAIDLWFNWKIKQDIRNSKLNI